MNKITEEQWGRAGLPRSLPKPHLAAEKADQKHIVPCKNCGTQCLHWVQINSGWRLFDKDGVIHSCK